MTCAKHKSSFSANIQDDSMTRQKMERIHKEVVKLLEQEGEEVFGIISTDRGRYSPSSNLVFTYLVGDATVVLNSRNDTPYSLPLYSFVRVIVASNTPCGDLESKLLAIEGIKKQSS